MIRLGARKENVFISNTQCKACGLANGVIVDKPAVSNRKMGAGCASCGCYKSGLLLLGNLCWIAGRRHACLGGSIQSHKNKDSLYGRKSLESGRIRQIVYKYRASPTVRSIDFIIPMHHSKRSIPQVNNSQPSNLDNE
jgi:hypothetical protein